jgi:hypothetical protein
MKRVLNAVIFCAGLLSIFGGKAWASDQIAQTEPGHGLARIPEALQKQEAGDYAGALDGLEAGLADPAFDQLSAKVRGVLLMRTVNSETILHHFDDAYRHLSQAGLTDPDLRDGGYWRSLAALAINSGHGDEVGAAIAQLADRYPDTLMAASDSEIYGLIQASGAGQIDDDVRFRLLETLWRKHYRPDTGKADFAWFPLFEIYVARQQDDKARQVAAALTDPRSLIRLRCDQRYARFAPYGPGHGDFNAALDASLAGYRHAMQKNPRSLLALNTYASALMNAARLDDAQAEVDAAMARLKSASSAKAAFDDADTQQPWLYDLQSDILGRRDDDQAMVAEQEKARDAAAKNVAPDADTVSQRLNLGNLYVAQEHSQDALNEVSGVDRSNASAYGVMVARKVEACAYAQLGDAVHLDASLTYLKAHIADSFGAVRIALECAGDEDGLAALLIRQLDDPMSRNTLLVDLQDYKSTDEETDYQRKLDSVNKAVLARDDVRAALARYGEIDSYPVYWAPGY